MLFPPAPHFFQPLPTNINVRTSPFRLLYQADPFHVIPNHHYKFPTTSLSPDVTKVSEHIQRLSTKAGWPSTAHNCYCRGRVPGSERWTAREGKDQVYVHRAGLPSRPRPFVDRRIQCYGFVCNSFFFSDVRLKSLFCYPWTFPYFPSEDQKNMEIMAVPAIDFSFIYYYYFYF